MVSSIVPQSHIKEVLSFWSLSDLMRAHMEGERGSVKTVDTACSLFAS